MFESKEADYFIRNPEAYRRLTVEDISSDGAVRLAETILLGLKDDMKSISAKIKQDPHDKECRASAVSMLHLLQSDYIDALTMGHGQAVADMFVGMCGGALR